MATFLQRTYIPQEKRQDTNFPLLAQVMQMKQGAYDANRAKIQQTLDAFGIQAQQVLRDEDKEYMAAKLSSIVSQINDYGNKDLSQSSVTEDLMGNIRAAASDPIIQNAIQTTQKFNSFKKEVAKLKEKNPELYSDINYQYALESAGLKDYMEGKTNTIGDLSYIEYTDVSLELKDISENLDKYAAVVKQTTPEGMYFVTKEGKTLSKQRIRQIAELQLSDKAKRQMQVNSWANFETKMSPESITQNFSKLRDTKLNNVDGQIQQLKVNIDNTNNPSEKIRLQQELEAYQSYRKQEKEAYDSYIKNGNVSAMAFSLEKEILLDNFATTYSPTFNINTTYSENTAFLKQEKLKADALKASTKQDSDNDGIPDIESTKIPTEYSSVEFYDSTIEKAKSFETGYKNKVKSIFENLTPEQKIAAETYLSDKNITEEDREDGLMDYFDELVSESSNIIEIGDIEEARMLQTESSENYSRYNNATKSAYVNLENKNLNRLYNAATEKANRIKTLDDEGNLIDLGDYLKNKGITTFKKFSENKDVQTKLWKQYYADMYLSAENNSLEAFGQLQSAIGASQRSPELLAKGAINQYEASQAGEIYKKRLVDILGSEKKAEEYISQVKSKGLYDTNKATDDFTNRVGIILPFSGLLNRDNSFEDDREGRSIITKDKIKSEAGDLLSKDYQGLSDRGVRVNVKTKAHDRILAIVGDTGIVTIGEEGRPFQVNDKTPFSLRMIDPNYVEVSQVKQSNLGEGEYGSFIEKAVIGIENIPEDIRAQINFEAPKQGYTKENFPQVNTTVNYINDSDVKRINDLTNNVFFGNKSIAYQTTKKETLGRMFRSYPQVLGTYKEPTNEGNILKKIINSNNLILSTTKTEEGIYPEIRFREGVTNITLGGFREPLPNDNLTAQYRIMKYAPQIFVNDFLNNILQDLALGQYNDKYEILERLYANIEQ